MTESDVAVLVERLDNLNQKVEAGQERAERWREHFDTKLDNRPCEKHAGFFRTIDLQLKAIWAIIGAIVITLLTEFIKR